MAAEDTPFRRRPQCIGSLGHRLIFPQVDAIQITRIKSFPPFTFSVLQCQISIVRNAGLIPLCITLKSRLPPPPGILMMERNTETDTGFPRSFFPFTEEIAFRTETGRIPCLIFRVPHIELIMMYSLYNQETCSGIFIDIHQSFRTEFRRIPVAQHLLITNLRRMTVLLQMVFICRGPFYIKLTGIPVATLASCLRSKVHPNTKLRITQPSWSTRIIGLYRIPSRFIQSRSDG